MTDEQTIRSFLALDPPEEILREIGQVQNRLQKLIHGDLRWVRPEYSASTFLYSRNSAGEETSGPE